MNAEYLLDAIGQLDDELVREAERYRRPRVRYGRILSLAASFAVVILLGYGVTHIKMGGMNGGAAPSYAGGGSSSAPAGGSEFPEDNSGAPRAGDSADAPSEPDSPGETALSSGEGVPNSAQTALPGAIFVRGASGSYILTGEVLAELPEDGEFVLLGQLLALYPDSPSPCTTVEEYVGLNLWMENDGTDLLTAVYVELPEGGFARAELAEP